MDRSQPGVAGPDVVPAPGLEVVEEIQHCRRVEVCQTQRRGWLTGALLEVAEQKLERVA
jgi:hypothetical protein